MRLDQIGDQINGRTPKNQLIVLRDKKGERRWNEELNCKPDQFVLHNKSQITATYHGRDEDVLWERRLWYHGPVETQIINNSLVTFVNKHSDKLHLEVNNLDKKVSWQCLPHFVHGAGGDGFFVPLYRFQIHSPGHWPEGALLLAIQFLPKARRNC